jgi:hypothetical protein
MAHAAPKFKKVRMGTTSHARNAAVSCAVAAVLLSKEAEAQWWRAGGSSPPLGSSGSSRSWGGSRQEGFTRPEELANLILFRDAMRARSLYWREATENWNCGNESDPYQLAACNPCGNEAWGYWKHVGCRGDPIPETPWEFRIPGNGYVTDFHITDYKVTGEVPLEYMCPFEHLRQFDMDGGWMTGQIPSEFYQCFPDLLEIDLSFNNLTGVLPREIGKLTKLHEFKIEAQSKDVTTGQQGVGGPIPDEFGGMASLRWMRLHDNRLNGTIPDGMGNTARYLQQLTMDENELEGNLYALKDHQFANIGVNNNEKLCGMVPLGVRYAHGFNYHGTRLGLPCPDEDVSVLQG